MKILVIATGGTIGSEYDGSAVDVAAGCAVADRYTAEYGDVGLEVTAPLSLLSESITAADFSVLAGAVYAADTARYGGIIITCGSDTLAYIASFVGLLFGGLDIPIMLVASNFVPDDPLSNGFDNFACAVSLIRQGVRGVLVPYRNRDGVTAVHAATALRQADYCDDFVSLYDEPYARYDGTLHQLHAYRPQSIPAGIFSAQHPPILSRKVLMTAPYPMLDYRALDTDGCAAVLHMLYHSGTLDASALAELIAQAGDRPVFLCSLREGRRLYRTTADAIALGAIPLYDISPECAYMKLLLAVNQDTLSIREFMEGKG